MVRAGLVRLVVAAVVIAVSFVLAIGVAGASAATISTSGPLTSIGVSEDLNCSVNHTGDTSGEFYGETACGTFVTVEGSHYGPASVPAGNAGSPAYTPVSQSAVTGSGTETDPYTIVTVVDLGTSGLRLTETDSYVVGQESYRTDVQIHNSSGASVNAILYRAGDCYLQNSDTGFGSVEAATGAVACLNAVETGPGEFGPGTRTEQWFPLSAGSHYYEGLYSSVWAATISGSEFPDSCACSENIDNGGGLSWSITIPAGGSVTRSSLITFSPLGHSPLSTSKTAEHATAAPGGSDGYTITISNPNTSAVSLSSIRDTLPAGFSYTLGSSSEATISDPTVTGQTLTWAGPISVPAASGSTPGTVSLHFGVTVASSSGTYFNNAGATASGYTVVPTGDTAPVEVTAPAPTVKTEPASAVAQTTATLNAQVNPKGSQVTACTLEYGTAIPYTKSAACSPAPGSGTTNIAVAAALSGLSENTTYHFRIVATNAGGSSAGADETFKTTSAPQPPLTGRGGGTGGDVGGPVLGIRETVRVVSGTVTIRIKGTSTFVPLSATSSIPDGSEVDATNGRVVITVATPTGGTATAEVYGGRFRIHQDRSGETHFILTLPLTGCPRASLPRGSAAALASAAKSRSGAKHGSGPTSRHLWVSEQGGSWGTDGRYASTTVRGTTWLTLDECTRSEVEVTAGKAKALDLVRKRVKTVSAGQRYVASASPHRRRP